MENKELNRRRFIGAVSAVSAGLVSGVSPVFSEVTDAIRQLLNHAE